MPSYEIQVDDNPHKIELTKTTQKTFTAKIDDKPRTIELETDKLNGEQAFTIRIDAKTYRIELSRIEQKKTFPIKVEEAAFKVEVRTSNRKQAFTSFEPTPKVTTRKAALSKQVAVEGAVIAPMTGKMVSVKVKKGDQVKANQVLCTIEAMKMENEITTPKAGTVQEVNVQDGQPVNEGETLFIIA
jgi:biotin carboxyl carrier protein